MPILVQNTSGIKRKSSSHLVFAEQTKDVFQVFYTYRKNSSISRILVGNIIVDNSDVVGASPVGAAPTTSSFST